VSNIRKIILLFALSLFTALVSAQSTTYTVRTAARVRAEPNTASAIVARLRAGTVVTVTAEVEGTRVSGSTVWYAVALEDDATGYIHSSLVRAGNTSVSLTPGPMSTVTAESPALIPTSAPAASNRCNGVDDLNCSDFSTSRAASDHVRTCGDEDKLDRDNDGRACESLP
jgi:uncharacterized protein YcgI (DUF1989 family)